MKTFPRLSFIVLVLITSDYTAQNLVPNGSFEEYVDCPIGVPDMQAVGWFQARGTCDYYNACATPGIVSVPDNVFGHQEALTGEAYAGFASFDTSCDNCREHLSIELIEALQPNIEYFVSFYISSAYEAIWMTKASNGQGAYFTSVKHSSLWDDDPEDNPSPLNTNGVILNENIISDTTSWVQLKGSFIADSAYTYIVIGEMLFDGAIDTSSIAGTAPYGSSYYYIDEIRVSTDSIYAWEVLPTNINDRNVDSVSIFPNPVQDILYIHSNSLFDRVVILDMKGRIVIDTKVKNLTNNSLDVSFLSKGFYILQLSDREGRSYSKKMIKH